jgi:hypothetical protein
MANRSKQNSPKQQQQWRKKMEDQNAEKVAPAAAPAAEAPPPAASSLDDLIAAGVAKALAGLAIPHAPAISPTAAIAASRQRPDADPNFVEGEGQARTTFEITLLQRHADWVVNVARANRVTPSHLLDVLVRRAWAADPTKGGTILVALPDEKGQPAATAPRQR